MDHEGVPSYDVLLKFIDLPAHCSETAESGEQKQPAGTANRKDSLRPSYMYVANGGSNKSNCVACKQKQHHLSSYRVFLGFSLQYRLSVIKENELCINCLKPEHFVRKCVSSLRRKVC